ncbi:S46 family peptidase [Isosphaeraceae bacterium EP7]
MPSRPIRPSLSIATAACLLIAGVSTLQADEGMWTFDNLPLKHLKDTYGFSPPPGWVEHLRGAALRFNNGGSGSFVSADGLVMTNHHVGADTLQKISTAEKDYYKIGFLAKTQADEVKAPDLELNVLVGIEDVTDKVNALVSKDLDDAAANVARRKAKAEIEKASLDATGLRSDVVTLYQGGKYALYTYKKYTDVRLVFAPEFAAAFFGGDPDNFEFPRWCLDVCFFRAYEDGKPARPKNFLTWSAEGSKEGDLTFVAGHPGRTSRLFTLDNLKYLRDTGLPFVLDMLGDRESFLQEYSKRGPEQARQAKEDLFGYQNSLKARLGGQKGLNDTALMDRKAAAETELRSKIDADPAKKKAYADAWPRIADSQKAAARILKPYNFLERGLAFDSTLFSIARTLARLTEEKTKPNADRLREYGEAGLASLEQGLYSDAPIYPEFETAKLGHSLEHWAKAVGADDPVVRKVLKGRTPAEVARSLVEGTKLADVETRKEYAKLGVTAVARSEDPMIQLALAVDPEARAVRKQREDEVEGVESAQYALIARAIFDDKGDSTYPDATFTLRLAFGTVKGYEVDGKTVPPFTTFAGAFPHAAKHDNVDPYELPASWHKAKDSGALKLDTPLNFVSTADIIGGNSGSPVVNRDNEVVGLIFDGNIQSLVLDYAYDDKVARAVSVDSRAIAEALRSIYSAEALLKELTGK